MYPTMKKRALGFTLVELMVAIAIAAILLAIAVPSFGPTIKRNRVQSQSREIQSALSSARSEAVSRGTRITLCHLTTAHACDGAWSSGLTVFTDTGVVGQFDGSDVVLHEYRGTGANTMKVYHDDSGNVADTQVSFNNRGEMIAAGSAVPVSFVVCDVDNDATLARAVLVTRVGQIMSASATIGAVSNDVAGNALVCP